MPALFADELAMDTRELVEQHVAQAFAQHRPMSFDDSLQRSHRSFRSRNSLPATVLRLSSSLGSSGLSSFGHIPGHEVIETTVRFLGVSQLDTHCEFRLHVDTGKESFVLQKRFSQFRDLRQRLLLHSRVAAAATDEKKRQSKCRSGACLQLEQQLANLKFPRRKMSFRLYRDGDVRVARERQAQLQNFVETVLAVYRTAPKRQVRCCVNSQCQVLAAIRSFLEISDLGEDELPDWKSLSNGSSYGGDMPILDTPPSTGGTIYESPVSSSSNGSNGSPIPARTSAMCLEELYTITEDTEHAHV